MQKEINNSYYCIKKILLYKAADIKLYIPEVKEAGHGIVPTSSTSSLALGDALAIASMDKEILEN